MRIVISGYYGFRNAGDEAMLAGIIAGLRRASVAQPVLSPSKEPPRSGGQASAASDSLALDLVVLSGAPDSTANDHRVRAIGRRDFRALRRELAQADLLITGGGNLFQDATSARSCLYYLAILREALNARVPAMVLGQGIGPLRRWWVRAFVRRYLNRVQGIALRDSESGRELEHMAVTAPARVGADLSFAMDPPDPAAVGQAWASLGIEHPSKVLAVAPRTWRISGAVGERVIERVAAAIKRAAGTLQPPPQVVVFPMQRPQDDAACAALASAVGGRFARDEFPPSLLAGLIGAARVTVGMRLHALMFAVMGGSMPVAVSYDPKVAAFMNDLGLTTAATTADLDEDRLASAIIEAWNAPEEFRARLRQAAAQRRRLVDEMFAWALQIAHKPGARL